MFFRERHSGHFAGNPQPCEQIAQGGLWSGLQVLSQENVYLRFAEQVQVSNQLLGIVSSLEIHMAHRLAKPGGSLVGRCTADGIFKIRCCAHLPLAASSTPNTLAQRDSLESR